MRRVSASLATAVRPLALSALAAVFAAALAACSTVSPSPDDPNRPTANTSGAGAKLLLGTANPQPLTAPVDEAIKRDCPPIDILDGAASFRVTATPGSTDPFDVRYQASIAETARECSSLGVEAGIRVGIVGRVIVGPKGAPGAVRVPLRIAVVDENSTPVYSQSHMIDVSIAPGEGKADFTRIEDSIVVPIPANRFRGWRILVGYDPKGAAEPKAARRRG